MAHQWKVPVTARPLALSLRWSRSLEGQEIADGSRGDVQAPGQSDENQLTAWQRRTEAIFPGVREGNQRTGALGGRQYPFLPWRSPVDTVHDPFFADAFFGIWLHAQTNASALHHAVPGLSNESWHQPDLLESSLQ